MDLEGKGMGSLWCGGVEGMGVVDEMIESCVEVLGKTGEGTEIRQLGTAFHQDVAFRPGAAAGGADHGTHGKKCAYLEVPVQENRTLEEPYCPDVVASAVARHAKLGQSAPQTLKVCLLVVAKLGLCSLGPWVGQLLGLPFVSPWSP
jgi:hypothetical protein